MKKCSKCGVEKELGEFSKDKSSKDGLSYWCKDCTKAKVFAWGVSNPEKRKVNVTTTKQKYIANGLCGRGDGNPLASRTMCQEHLNYTRETSLFKIGWTLEKKRQAFIDQGYKCAICGRENEEGVQWSADHDHETGEARGVLCGTCNVMIGMAKDKIEILQQAIDYLKTHRSRYETDTKDMQLLPAATAPEGAAITPQPVSS